MPRTYDHALFSTLYRMTDPDDVTNLITYGRKFSQRFLMGDTPEMTGYIKRATRVSAAGATGSVLVVGCAFGHLMEELISLGLTDVWGIDPSPYIWDPAQDSEWDPAVKARVANDYLGSLTAAGSLQAIGAPAKFNWIVDEDALSSQLDDTEINAFLSDCDALIQGPKSKIIHVITTRDSVPAPGGSAFLLWKTMAEWEAYAPTHTWIEATDDMRA